MNGAVWIVIGLILLWFITTYNSLIRLRNDVKKSFSGIDVQLKRRTDLIPNLVNVVKGYAKHEKILLENITKARSDIMNASKTGDIKGMANGENMLTGTLKSLFAVAENYPDLKANDNFKELQNQLTHTEDQIAAARRIYNENVTYLNTKIQVFPAVLVASLLGFRQKELFEASVIDRKKVKVGF